MKILRKVSKVYLGHDACFKSSSVAGETVCYPIEVSSPYSQAIKILRKKSNNSKKLVSDQALETKLDDFIRQLIHTKDQEKIKREIGKYIKILFTEIAKLDSTSFIFLIPIMGLDVENKIMINGSTIFGLTTDNLADLEKELFGQDY